MLTGLARHRGRVCYELCGNINNSGMLSAGKTGVFDPAAVFDDQFQSDGWAISVATASKAFVRHEITGSSARPRCPWDGGAPAGYYPEW
jgi:hypothetical protein